MGKPPSTPTHDQPMKSILLIGKLKSGSFVAQWYLPVELAISPTGDVINLLQLNLGFLEGLFASMPSMIPSPSG